MVAAGILRRADRRRFGLFRVETYQPPEETAVRVRASVRDIPDTYHRTCEYAEPRMIALAALGHRAWTDPPAVFRPSQAARLDQWLRSMIDQYSDPTLSEVATAVAT